jgi:hypothetical protein
MIDRTKYDCNLKLQIKTTLNRFPKEQVQKMVEDFHSKDYLAVAIGA